MSALAIRAVGRVFPGVHGGAPTVALQPTTLDVATNDFITILGPSGCGKSTLLRIVAGLDTPSEGEVRLDGQPVRGPGADRGMVFQSYTLFPWLTVRENICFGLREKGLPLAQQHEIARRFVAEVGLEGFESHFPKQLSGGMQQRVALARALANDPKILLLDEPFGALDALTRAHLQDAVMEIHSRLGNTMVMITHDVDEAVLLSHRIVMMTNGPAAHIGEVLDVPIARPRNRIELASDRTYLKCREAVLKFLYERHRFVEAAE